MKKTKIGLIQTAEFEQAAGRGEIESLEIVETESGWKVIANIKPRPAERRFLTTRRDPDTPRMYHHLQRLNDAMSEILPKTEIKLTKEKPYDSEKVRRSKKS